jgi:HlyD family secretion protein
MKKALSILAAVVVITLFGGTLYYLWAKSRQKPVLYDTQSPQTATIMKKAVATGSVVPREEVEIKPQISGIIDELPVEPGEHVAKGDLLARIRLIPDMVTLNNAQNRLNRAEIARAQAQRNYERNLALVKDGTIAQSLFQDSETELQNAREELEAARDNLDLVERGTSRRQGATTNTLVRATIAGMVLEVPVKVGTSVIEANTFNAGTTIATVADMADMIFQGTVDESEVGKLREGMTLLLTIGAIQDQKLEATLEYIAPKGVEEEGAIQFQIRAAVKPQPDLFIRANYSANADVVLERRDDVLSIPESLVQFEDGKKFVEVETAPQVFEKREIQTGLSDGIQIEIVSGLTADDKIKAGPRAEGPPGGQRAGAPARR